MKDIDSIYIELPTNIVVHKDSLKEEESLAKYIYQMSSLRTNGEITPNIADFNIRQAFKKYMTPTGNFVFNHIQYKSESVNKHIIKILVQAIGRICRTNKDENYNVNIYVDNEILKQVDFSIMKNRKMNPEFRKIVEISNYVVEYSKEINRNLNLAENRDDCIKQRIENILSENKTSWKDTDMRQWRLIREATLKYPTTSKEILNNLVQHDGLESYKDCYLYAVDERKINSYVYNFNSNKRKIIYGNVGSKEKGDIVIDSNASRLNIVLQSPNVREAFIKNGYALEFKPDECILLPTVFNNIYKGALGEAAGKAILEAHGIKLKEITDPAKFEKFDYCLEDNPDVYIDFKNWSENDIVDEKKNIDKIIEKLDKINGKKVFIVNIFSSKKEPENHGRVVLIPSLFGCKNNRVFELNLTMGKIVKMILEACNNGDN